MKMIVKVDESEMFNQQTTNGVAEAVDLSRVATSGRSRHGLVMSEDMITTVFTSAMNSENKETSIYPIVGKSGWYKTRQISRLL